MFHEVIEHIHYILKVLEGVRGDFFQEVPPVALPPIKKGLSQTKV
jgi:hypothetical protein